jgi:hypothetical protein
MRKKQKILRRMGTTYLLVLMVTAIVFTVGYAGIQSVRIQRLSTRDTNDAQEALWLAYAGLEHAVARIYNTDNWRTAFANNVDTPSIQMGKGSFQWRLVDEDGNLANNDNDSVTVISTGKSGAATRVLKQELIPTGQGLPVLDYAAYSLWQMDLHSNKIWAGKFGCNATIVVPGGHVVKGNGQGVIAEAQSFSVHGSFSNGSYIVTPNKTWPNSVKAMERFKARATMIPFSSVSSSSAFDGKMVSAKANPWGAANPEGIYFISVGSFQTLTIRNCRIKGTLLVELAGNATLEIDQSVIWEPHEIHFPALIARGLSSNNVSIRIDGSGELNEATWGVNFNPPQLPLRGEHNLNQTDRHPAALRGLFHIIRNTDDSTRTILTGAALHKMCLLTGGRLRVENTSIMHDPELFADAPQGYIANPIMRPRAGTIEWIATE